MRISMTAFRPMMVAIGLQGFAVAVGACSIEGEAGVGVDEAESSAKHRRDAGAIDAAPADAGAGGTDAAPPPDGSSSSCATPGPVTAYHHAPNSNFDAAGNFAPAVAGFNVADVSSASEASALPPGVVGLVWVGTCNGADAAFVSAMRAFAGNTKVFGFYLMDEPDPTGQYAPLCPAANLKAESDWIHANLPGTKTYVTLMNFDSTKSPTYANTYDPANTGIDLYGLDPYPCRTDLGNQCDFSIVAAAVNAAMAAGIPRSAVVPVYQAFGGGGYVDDSGGSYSLPTASQETELLAAWKSVVPTPVFDYAYSWGSQNGDTALAQSPALQQVFAAHASAACGP